MQTIPDHVRLLVRQLSLSADCFTTVMAAPIALPVPDHRPDSASAMSLRYRAAIHALDEKAREMLVTALEPTFQQCFLDLDTRHQSSLADAALPPGLAILQAHLQNVPTVIPDYVATILPGAQSEISQQLILHTADSFLDGKLSPASKRLLAIDGSKLPSDSLLLKAAPLAEIEITGKIEQTLQIDQPSPNSEEILSAETSQHVATVRHVRHHLDSQLLLREQSAQSLHAAATHLLTTPTIAAFLSPHWQQHVEAILRHACRALSRQQRAYQALRAWSFEWASLVLPLSDFHVEQQPWAKRLPQCQQQLDDLGRRFGQLVGRLARKSAFVDHRPTLRVTLSLHPATSAPADLAPQYEFVWDGHGSLAKCLLPVDLCWLHTAKLSLRWHETHLIPWLKLPTLPQFRTPTFAS